MNRKRLLAVILFTCISLMGFTQNQDIRALVSNGNKVFIEVVDVTGDIDGEYEYFVKHLNDKEFWGFWNIVSDPQESDFICKLTLKKRMVVGAAKIDAYIEILDKDENILWRSKHQTGKVSIYTGFNAHGDAMRKIIRRSLSDELYKKHGIELQ